MTFNARIGDLENDVTVSASGVDHLSVRLACSLWKERPSWSVEVKPDAISVSRPQGDRNG